MKLFIIFFALIFFCLWSCWLPYYFFTEREKKKGFQLYLASLFCIISLVMLFAGSVFIISSALYNIFKGDTDLSFKDCLTSVTQIVSLIGSTGVASFTFLIAKSGNKQTAQNNTKSK